MTSTEEDKCFLCVYLTHNLIQGYIKDIKEFSEKEMYNTPAILVLEMEDELTDYPLETIALIWTIKKYKKCIAPSTINLLNKALSKDEKSTNALYTLSYKERKEILLELTRGLNVCSKFRDTVNKTAQDQKDTRYLERQKGTLQKELDIFKVVEEGKQPEPVIELSEEKKKEIKFKCRELNKITQELKKRKSFQTTLLGLDADEKEYWIFIGDKGRIYVKTLAEDKEKWGTYGTLTQANSLMGVLLTKGRIEKKLHTNLQSIIPNLRLIDPNNEE